MRYLAAPAVAGAMLGLASLAHGHSPSAGERAQFKPSGPEQAAAYQRGLDLAKREAFGEAVAAFDEVLRLQPEFAVARSHRAFAYMKLGDYAKAIADHDAVLEQVPGRPNSWSNSCWARAAANVDLDLALERCNRALEMADGEGALDSRGLVHFRRGEFAQAIGDYTRAIRKRPKFASPWFMRGVARLRAGQEAQGRADIRRALKLDPRIAEAYARRGVQP